MANKTEIIETVCPFWEGDSMKAITCEGLIGVRCACSFATVSDRVKHKTHYCCENWKACEMAKVLLAKYGEY